MPGKKQAKTAEQAEPALSQVHDMAVKINEQKDSISDLKKTLKAERNRATRFAKKLDKHALSQEVTNPEEKGTFRDSLGYHKCGQDFVNGTKNICGGVVAIGLGIAQYGQGTARAASTTVFYTGLGIGKTAKGTVRVVTYPFRKKNKGLAANAELAPVPA